MRQSISPEQWDQLKKVAKGEAELEKITVKYSPPKYCHKRVAWVVRGSDGKEHIFDKEDRGEAEEFYQERISHDSREE